MNDRIVTPSGRIVYWSPHRLSTKSKRNNSDQVYLVKCEYDGSTAEGKVFKDKLLNLNDKVVTEGVTSPDHFTFRAWSHYIPKVFDGNGDQFAPEAIPSVKSGNAVMVVQPDTKNELGAAFYLAEVILLDYIPFAGESGLTAEERQEIIRKNLENAVGGSSV